MRQPILSALFLIQPDLQFFSPAHLPPHPEQAVLGQLVHAEVRRLHFFRQLFREAQLHEAVFHVDDGGGEIAFGTVYSLTIMAKSDIICRKEREYLCQ